MVEIQRGTLLAAAATLLLLVGVGSAQAEGECGQARNACQREATEALRLCREDCGGDFREAIANVRATCREQGLTHRECRDLAVATDGTDRAECASECRPAFRDDRKLCQEESRECRESMHGERDEACVAACREEFAPCHEEQRSCHEDCRAGARESAEACLEADLEFREKMLCIRDARLSIRECALDCQDAGDANACHEDLRICVSECPFAEDSEL